MTDGCNEINVRGDEAIQVQPIEEVGDRIYEASFMASRCGYYMISITIDGSHVPGNPYTYVRNSLDLELASDSMQESKKKESQLFCCSSKGI